MVPSLKVRRVPFCCSPGPSPHPMGAGSRHPYDDPAAGLEELKAAPAVWQRLTKSSFVCDEQLRLGKGR